MPQIVYYIVYYTIIYIILIYYNHITVICINTSSIQSKKHDSVRYVQLKILWKIIDSNLFIGCNEPNQSPERLILDWKDKISQTNVVFFLHRHWISLWPKKLSYLFFQNVSILDTFRPKSRTICDRAGQNLGYRLYSHRYISYNGFVFIVTVVRYHFWT